MTNEHEPTETRQAEKHGVVRYVLAASLSAVVIGMAVVFFYFAS